MPVKKESSRLGGSPLAGMDLLSSTVDVPVVNEKKVKAAPVAKKVEKPKESKPVASKPVKAATPKALAPGVGDQYGYERQNKWPLLDEASPYLVAVPSSGDKILSTAFTMRLPLDLDVTVDAHCKNLRVNKSEWVRQAMLRQLAEEQEILDKISSNKKQR